MLDKLMSRAFKFRLKKPYSTHVYDMSRGKRADQPPAPAPDAPPAPAPRKTSLMRRKYFGKRVAEQQQQQQGRSVYERIAARELPADILYEDELCLAFTDATPHAPVHFLVVPKRRIHRLDDCTRSDAELLAHLVLTAKSLAAARAPRGYRLLVNSGPDAAQTVDHLHIHVLGGRALGWPPG